MDRPPLYYKVWWWILTNVDRNSGCMTTTMDHIADRVQWVERGVNRTPNRKVIKDILNWLSTELSIVTETGGAGNRKYTKVSVINWATYQQTEVPDGNRIETETVIPLHYRQEEKYKESTVQAAEPASTSPASTSSSNQASSTTAAPSSNGRPKRTTTPYQPSEQATRTLAAWESHAALPATCNRSACLQTLDRLLSIDNVSWDRINRLCAYAVKEWVPKGFLASPMSLREWTRKKDMRVWEALERQALTDEATAKDSTPKELREMDERVRRYAEEAKRRQG